MCECIDERSSFSYKTKYCVKQEIRVVKKRMNFLKNFTKHQIFERVAEIANTQIKQKIKSKLQSTKQPTSANSNPAKSHEPPKSQQAYQQPSYDQAEQFIVQLSQNRKHLTKQKIEKRTKKDKFSQLQIDPIYLQQCSISQLFKMELEFTNDGGYERTQVLHQYLNQVYQTIRKVMFADGDLQILQVFCIFEVNLVRIQKILVKVRQARQRIIKNKQNQQKSLQIKNTMTRKNIIKQKLALLTNMKQKQQITLLQPQNLQQIYYSQRNRHKLYNKIKNTTVSTSYFTMLKSQLISISKSNSQIISQYLDRWINKQQHLRQKNIEKLFICLYFVKNQSIYLDNSIGVSFKHIDKPKLLSEIQQVKTWKNFQYIRDPAMKGKINQFLDLLIHQINSMHQ